MKYDYTKTFLILEFALFFLLVAVYIGTMVFVLLLTFLSAM